MASPRKVILIGLDGAPYDLVKRWADQGKLPNMSKLMGRGSHGTLFSPLDVTPPAWSTIYTGKNPGKHGVYDFAHRAPGSYEFGFANSTTRRSADVWEILSRAGLKVAVVNTPLTFPVRPVNGVMVSGFLTPRFSPKYTYPQSLKSELEKAAPGFGPSIPGILVQRLSRKAYVRLIGRRLDNLAKAVGYLIKKEDFQFFAVVASETDFIQHWYWRDMVEGRGKFADAVLSIYKKADEMVGELVSAAGEEAYVMIVSDHGGAPRKGVFHTNEFLYKIGALRFRQNLGSRVRAAMWRGGMTGKLHRTFLRYNVFFLKLLINPLVLTTSDVDFAKSWAYSEGYGQIYFNVEGREPNGKVAASKVGAFADSIVRELQRLPAGSVGGKIDRIYKKDEMFTGPYLQSAPDIQFTMLDGYEADTQFLEEIERSGTHNHFGTLIVSGEGTRTEELEGASVADIAPTILGILGVPIPREMDGHFLAVAFTKAKADSFSVRVSEEAQGELSEKYEFSEAERETIEKNLRSLGYV